MDGVISVIPNHILKIHTTRSWDFMGFSKSKLSGAQQGNVIIGLLDTGAYFSSIFLESVSEKFKVIILMGMSLYSRSMARI